MTIQSVTSEGRVLSSPRKIPPRGWKEIAIALLAVVPAVLSALGVYGPVGAAISFVRWPPLAVLAMTWLAVLYRYAPSRKKPKWRWVSPGAVVAMFFWIAAS